jgi:rhodanese-related sulfurtransferase
LIDLRPNDFKNEMIGDFLLIDVRTNDEHKEGHIIGSVLIPVDQLEKRLCEINDFREKKVLVYCRSGARSNMAAGILKQNKFKKVFNLIGGFIGWQSFGM